MITKNDIRKMSMKKALELLLNAARSHYVGSGCGPGHRIPVGEERDRLEIAMAKIHFKLYGFIKQY